MLGTLHYQTFNGPLSRTTRVSRYQKGKTNLDFSEARDSEWQWQVAAAGPYASLHLAPATNNSVFTGRVPVLPPNRQCQGTEGSKLK